MRLITLVCTAALLAICATALAASARPIDAKLSFHLGPQPGEFSGAVRADNFGCTAGRRIFVIRIEPGPKIKVARDFSDINGLWSRRTDELAGAWYAKLKPERRGNLFCKGDKSPVHAAG